MILGIAAAPLAVFIAPPAALAQEFPHRAVRLVVPFARGGGTELGMPDITGVSWLGLMAPPGLPAPIVTRLAGEVAAIAEQTAFRNRMIEIGREASPMDPASFARYLAGENRRWAKIVADAKIPPQD